jgi:transcription termination factor NusB
MPYTIRKNAPGCPESKPYAVVKTSDGEVMGCHPSSQKAGAQIAAIEANEKAAATPEGAMGTNSDGHDESTDTISLDSRHQEAVVDERSNEEIQADKMKALRIKYRVPYEATSFDELDSYREAKRVADAQYSVLHDFQLLQENIIYSDEIEDKAAAIAALAGQLSERMKMAESEANEKSVPDEDAIDGITTMADKSTSGTGFSIEKQADGSYRWLAVYSNKYRDRDHPPEIISEESHLAFIKAVESGAVDYPELWLWHIPGTRIGQADFLTYADGFAIAGGTIDEQHSDKARKLSQIPDLGVSHGMPHWSLKRRADDPSVIDRHITSEISPLDMDAAANLLTGFILEDKDMANIKQNQLDFLRRLGYSDEAIENLGKTVEAKAAEAQEMELESKNQEDAAEGDAVEEEEVVDAATETDEEVVAEAEEEEVKSTDDLRTEVAEAMAEMVKGVNDAIEDLRSAIQPTLEEMQVLKERMDQIERSDGDKIAEKAADTPQASLASMVYNSIVGKEGARVDGREKLAKDGPQEADAEEPTGPFFKQWTRS